MIIVFAAGVKGAQVEEIYDLSKPFRGLVQRINGVCFFYSSTFCLEKI